MSWYAVWNLYDLLKRRDEWQQRLQRATSYEQRRSYEGEIATIEREIAAKSQDAQAVHDAADLAAYGGDHDWAQRLRRVEGNLRGGEVMHRWAYEHLAATEDGIRRQADHLALGWNADPDVLLERALGVYRDAARDS